MYCTYVHAYTCTYICTYIVHLYVHEYICTYIHCHSVRNKEQVVDGQLSWDHNFGLDNINFVWTYFKYTFATVDVPQ